MRRRRWPAVVPFLACAGLAAWLAAEVAERLEPGARPAGAVTGLDMAPPPEPGTAGVPAAVLEVPPRDAFAAVVERNLFAIDRNPPTDAPDPEPEASDPEPQRPPPPRPLDAKLTGIVIAGDKRIAVLADPDTGAETRVRPGDTYRGWRLVRLSTRNATFRRDGRTIRVDLSFTADLDSPATEPRRVQPARPSRNQSAARRSSPVPSLQDPGVGTRTRGESWNPLERPSIHDLSGPYLGATVESLQGTGGALRHGRGGLTGNILDPDERTGN